MVIKDLKLFAFGRLIGETLQDLGHSVYSENIPYVVKHICEYAYYILICKLDKKLNQFFGSNTVFFGKRYDLDPNSLVVSDSDPVKIQYRILF